MQPELQEISNVVVMAVENAVGPLRERLAASEAHVTGLTSTVADLRLRLAASEARVVAPAVDPSIYDRLATSEAQVRSLQAMTDRLQALEARPTVAPDADLREQVKSLAQLPERMAVVESRLSTPAPADPAVADLRERMHVVETKAAVGPERYELPGVTGADMDALTERVLRLEIAPAETDAGLHERVRALELAPDPVDVVLRDQVKGLLILPERLSSIEATVSGLSKASEGIADIRDRQVAMEARAAVVVAPETDVRDHLVALSPVVERLASVEAEIKSVKDGMRATDGLRDRLVIVETTVKGLVERPEPQPDMELRDRVRELSNLGERVGFVEVQTKGAAETHAIVDQVVSRVVVLETKADQPVVDQHADLPARVHALEAVPPRVAAIEAVLPRIGEQDKAVAELRERLAVTEARPAVASLAPDTELRDRVSALEHMPDVAKNSVVLPAIQRLEERAAVIETRVADTVTVQKDMTSLRERVAVAEVRAFTPGPTGAAGRDGVDGKPGVDGVSYDKLTATVENDRTFVIRAIKGDRVEEIGSVAVPFMMNRGIWSEKDYERGDVVTWSGSMWHCEAPTRSKPGEGSPHWRLIVKRGSDGRDLREADATPPGLPVVRTR